MGLVNMDIKTKVVNYLNYLSEEQLAYLLGILIFLILIITKYILSFIYIDIPIVIFWFPVLILIYGFIYFWVDEFDDFWHSILGKIIITAIITIAGTFSLAFSSQAINSSFQVPAASFEYTQIILSVFLVPLVTSIIFGLFGFFLFPVLMVMSIGFQKPFSIKRVVNIFFRQEEGKSPQAFTFFVRMLLLICSIGFAWNFNNNNEWYTSPLEDFSKWFAYHFEMEKYSGCSLEENEKIAYIDSKNIIIGMLNDKQEYSFKVDKCSHQKPL